MIQVPYNNTNNNSYESIKTFSYSVFSPTWTYKQLNNFVKYITTIIPIKTYIQDDLYVKGNIYANTIIQTSDIKIKENIKYIKLDDDLNNKIKMLKPIEFTYKNSVETDTYNIINNKNYGFIAQDITDILPNLIHKNEINNLLNIKYTDIIPLLVLKINDLETKIDNLQKIINDNNLKIKK